jgi:NAD(P)-dependent dehydrogenase (short-subunit alcohol dehydrogenase family)
MKQSLDGRTVLVTGANGGLGQQFVEQALERGATKVYAAARSPKRWVNAKVEAVSLDITNAGDIARIGAAARDVDLLINNAGIAPEGDSRDQNVSQSAFSASAAVAVDLPAMVVGAILGFADSTRRVVRSPEAGN